jgi:AraC-like DNA-binding protein
MIDTSIDSFNFYFLIAVIQGIILSGFIIFRKPRRKSNTFLGLLILLFSLSLLHIILEESIHAFNSKFPIPMDFSLAYGPLAYFHLLYLKNPKERFKLNKLLHFLPSILIDGILFIITFLFIGSHEDWAYKNIETIQFFSLIIISLSLIQLSFYTYLIYKEVKHIKSLSKEILLIRKWFKILSLVWFLILLFFAIAIPLAILNIETLDEHSYLMYKPMGVIIGIGIYGLGYLYLLKYMTQVNIYIDRLNRIKFSEEEILKKRNILINLLEKDKLYTNNSISVSSLAKHLNWPINDVSFIINETLLTNFNDLINTHRIKAFKILINNPSNKKYSILGLAKEVGFNSKTSFYRAFKKETGITPSEYLKSF